MLCLLCRAVQVGGIRRIIVPVELGYPDNDYNKAGPKPTTFSGEPGSRTIFMGGGQQVGGRKGGGGRRFCSPGCCCRMTVSEFSTAS